MVRARPLGRCSRPIIALRAISRLLHAVHDPPAGEVVRRDLDADPVTGQHADAVAAHLAGEVRQHLVVIHVELDAEQQVGERLDDFTFESDLVLYGHAASFFAFGFGVRERAWKRASTHPDHRAKRGRDPCRGTGRPGPLYPPGRPIPPPPGRSDYATAGASRALTSAASRLRCTPEPPSSAASTCARL